MIAALSRLAIAAAILLAAWASFEDGRAWVEVGRIEGVPKAVADHADIYTELTIGYRNYGRSTAFDMVEAINAVTSPVGLFPSLTDTCPNPGPGPEGWRRSLAPGATTTLRIGVSDHLMPWVNSRAHYLAAVGCLTYTTRGFRRKTPVCMILEPMNERPGQYITTYCHRLGSPT